MTKKNTPQVLQVSNLPHRRLLKGLFSFLNRNWIGFAIITVAVSIFFWPIITRIDSYSEGGDTMFNAWTLARNHQCILGNNCSEYANANIYYPNEDTMLFSETQLSTGVITLPLYFINNNPLFAYNVWTIVSYLLTGFFMYLLAKYLSKGNEVFSVAAGLVFALAPFKMSAVTHLQNLSILYLPLIVLFILRYNDTKKKRFLLGIFLSATLLFHGSWYNLVFSSLSIGIILAVLAVFKCIEKKKFFKIVLSLALALLTTVPLMLLYVSFSKEQGASFSLSEQALYSSSVIDYLIPHNGTGLGMLAEGLKQGNYVNAVNADSFSYHGVSLYITGLVVIVLSIVHRKKRKPASLMDHRIVWALGLVGIVGFIFSLGSLIKITNSIFYGPVLEESIRVVLVGPYYLLLKILPELSFIRAVGRWSVLVLFALCCLLALFSVYRNSLPLSKNKVKLLSIFLLCFLFFELYPLRQVPMSALPAAYGIETPQVYNFIKDNQDVDNIIILNADYDYPNAPGYFARAEQVLWAGYHNKNIFNGYSGYTPPNYFKDFEDFVNFDDADVDKLRALDIRFILVDKLLMTTKPYLNDRVQERVPNIVYSDERFSLYKIN